MNVAVQRLPKNTIKITVTVEAEKVKESYLKIFSEVSQNIEVDGFRKGRAPSDLVEQKIDQNKLNSEIMSDLIKTFYPKALKDQNIAPITNPKIDIENFDREKDFTFTAEIAIRPQVSLGDYKKAIKDLYDKKKSSDTPKAEDGHIHLTPNDVVEAILSVTTVEVPDILIEEEVNKMLSRLVNQVQAIKLDMDAYLKSQNKTGDSLKKEYSQIAERNIKGELALVEVVKQENVTVDDSEIEATINAAGDPKFKERYSDPLEKEYIKAIIAKNKVIWTLISEAEGEKKDNNNAPDKPKEKEEDV